MSGNTSSTSGWQKGVQDASRSHQNCAGYDQFEVLAGASSDVNEAEFDCDDEDEGPTPHEYARSIGFCNDFLREDPLFSPALTSLPWSVDHDLDEPQDAPCVVDISSLEFSTERLAVPNEHSKAAMLLVQKTVKCEDNYTPLCGLPEIKRRRRVKVELPLLATDHEVDMKIFTRVHDVSIENVKLPLEFLDRELDESMEWPTRFDSLPTETIERIAKEHMVVPLEHLRFLSRVVKDEENTDLSDPWGQFEAYKRKKTDRMTPPLLPLESPPLTCFDPSSETAHLPIFSDNSTLPEQELHDIELRLQDEDRIASAIDLVRRETFDTDDFARIYTPFQSELDSVNELPTNKRKVKHLQVEVPLMLSDGSSSTTTKKCKTVSFSDDLCSYVDGRPPSHLIGELNTDAEESVDKFFEDTIKPEALQAERTAEQEQLIAADSLQRMHVRVMDFSLPPPPWSAHTSEGLSTKVKNANMVDAWTNALTEIEASFTNIDVYKPARVTTKVERELQPYPFDARLGKVPVEPPINDTRYMAVLMSDLSLEGVVQSDALVWKPEGLRIARRSKYEYEEELEVEDYDDTQEQVSDMDGLLFLRQQRIALAAKNQGSTFSDSQPGGSRGIRNDQRNGFSRSLARSDQQGCNVAGGLLNDDFTTTDKLSALMGSMGQKTSVAPQHNQFSAKVMEAPLRAQGLFATTTDIGNKMQQEVMDRKSFLWPSVPAQPPARSVVLSLDLLQTGRKMLRMLFKDLHPTATHIERDFSTVKNAPEADMLISPGVGIIFTTLQKLKQKSLPGQAAQLNGTRDRLARLSSRYETLIVLVGDAIKHDGLDQHDCEAIADFEAFRMQCKTDVLTKYMPVGDEGMASWVASLIQSYGDSGQELNLLQEETMWEQTLRRAGLNAYAAQSVLASLKHVASTPSSRSPREASERTFGLSALIRMSPEQRIASFSTMMGGANVLQRVNRNLEQNWLSAKSGYH